jgi:hypothetical protein
MMSFQFPHRLHILQRQHPGRLCKPRRNSVFLALHKQGILHVRYHDTLYNSPFELPFVFGVTSTNIKFSSGLISFRNMAELMNLQVWGLLVPTFSNWGFYINKVGFCQDCADYILV